MAKRDNIKQTKGDVHLFLLKFGSKLVKTHTQKKIQYVKILSSQFQVTQVAQEERHLVSLATTTRSWNSKNKCEGLVTDGAIAPSSGE